MSCTRSKIVSLAQEWVGLNEADGSHKKIIDIYNSQKPLPRGYAVKYTDAWCATTVSALAIACGATDIIPVECSCTKLIEIAKEMGIWVEADNYVPAPGDFILYDWQDTTGSSGENKGAPDHIGIVEHVVNDTITVIEGNADTNRDGKDGVERRNLEVNGKYIRGFITPNYDDECDPPEEDDANQPSQPSTNGDVVPPVSNEPTGEGEKETETGEKPEHIKPPEEAQSFVIKLLNCIIDFIVHLFCK